MVHLMTMATARSKRLVSHTVSTIRKQRVKEK